MATSKILKSRLFRGLLTNLAVLLFGVVLGLYLVELIFGDSYRIVSDRMFEILKLLVNLVLAIYIASVLRKHTDAERTEKDLLIKHMGEFEDFFITRIRKLVSATDSVEFSVLVSNLKNLRLRMSTMLKIAEKYKFIEDNDPTANAILNNIRDLQDLLTDTPLDKASRTDEQITISANKVSYGHLRLDSIAQEINNIKILLFDLVVKINRADC